MPTALLVAVTAGPALVLALSLARTLTPHPSKRDDEELEVAISGIVVSRG